MKKYWKLIAFGCATLLVLGIFYTKNSTYSKHLPQFSLETIQGDDEIADSFTLFAEKYYMDSIESLKLDKNGTSYLRDESYFTRLEGFTRNQEEEKWQEEYRSFMRGKDEYTGGFYETEEKLAYASVLNTVPLRYDYDTFNLEVLDKTSKKVKGFKVDIPDYSKYWNQQIMYVNLKDDELSIIMERNYDVDENTHGTHIDRYTFDMEKEQIIDEERILESEMNYAEDIHEEIMVHTSDQDKNHVIIAHQLTRYEFEEDEQGEIIDSKEFVETDELIKYNAETKSKEVIKLPKDIESAVFMAFDEEKYYFTDEKSPKVKVIPYLIDGGKIEDAWEVDVPRPEGGSWANYATVKDQKVYFLNENYEESGLPTIFALDLQKEALAYLGEITVNKESIDSNEFYFGEMTIQ